MTRYDAIVDPLCYPDTYVLINKAGIRDQTILDQYEQLMFLTRAEEDLPGGHMDYAHYKAVHHHFFQDVYDWAGNIRAIRTAKSGNWFCYPENIDAEMNRVFEELRSEHLLTRYEDKSMFADRAAYFLSEINAVHPFREGNGRSQLTFLSMLCTHAGQFMDEDQIDEVSFLDAMIESFDGTLAPLSSCIREML